MTSIRFFNDSKVNITLMLSARHFTHVYFLRSSCNRYVVIFLPEECYKVHPEKILRCVCICGMGCTCLYMFTHVWMPEADIRGSPLLLSTVCVEVSH